MSILAAVPGGSILSAVESAVAFSEADCGNYVEQLAEGLTGPQREVWEANQRFKLLCSGRRFGKTYLCITRLICWALEKPGSLCWYQEQSDWDTFSFTTIQGGNVSAEEIEAARNTLDERTFRQEYLASFETLSGRVYPGFDDENISEDVQDTGGPIYWGTDFNVSIMAGVLGSRVGDTLHIWDELAVKQSNTDEVCALLKQRFPDRQIVAYPDPTGSARKTSSAGRTDHDIIRRFGFSCISPKAPWSVKDKINATNWMIRTAKGSLRLFVHPRCKHTIKALRNVTYKQGAEDYVIDKTANIEHWTDGLGYLILGAFNPLHERAGRGTGIRLY